MFQNEIIRHIFLALSTPLAVSYRIFSRFSPVRDPLQRRNHERYSWISDALMSAIKRYCRELSKEYFSLLKSAGYVRYQGKTTTDPSCSCGSDVSSTFGCYNTTRGGLRKSLQACECDSKHRLARSMTSSRLVQLRYSAMRPLKLFQRLHETPSDLSLRPRQGERGE